MCNSQFLPSYWNYVNLGYLPSLLFQSQPHLTALYESLIHSVNIFSFSSLPDMSTYIIPLPVYKDNNDWSISLSLWGLSQLLVDLYEDMKTQCDNDYSFWWHDKQPSTIQLFHFFFFFFYKISYSLIAFVLCLLIIGKMSKSWLTLISIMS